MSNVEQFEGRWREPAGAPVGKIEWQAPGKGGLQTYVALVDGKVFSTLRKHRRQNVYIVRITGWVWCKPAEESLAAKINIEETEVKAFVGLVTAKKAAQYSMERLHAALINQKEKV